MEWSVKNIMSKQYLCPDCGNIVIKETLVTDYAFVCWFCDTNFYSFEVIDSDRELSSNRIRQELRKHLGQFLKKCGVQSQIQILSQAFFEYENFCHEQNLKPYSPTGLTAFVQSVQNWQIFFEQNLNDRQTA